MCRKQTLKETAMLKTEHSKNFKRQILSLEHQISSKYNTKTKESSEALMTIYLTPASSRKPV